MKKLTEAWEKLDPLIDKAIDRLAEYADHLDADDWGGSAMTVGGLGRDLEEAAQDFSAAFEDATAKPKPRCLEEFLEQQGSLADVVNGAMAYTEPPKGVE